MACRGRPGLARKGHVSKYLKVSILGQAWTVHWGWSIAAKETIQYKDSEAGAYDILEE